MADLTELARPAIQNLLQSDESQLYEELGIRVKTITSDPSKSGSFSPEVEYKADEMGVLDDLRDFGRSFFNRVSVSAYNLICGTEVKDAKEREKLQNAFGIGKEEVAAAVAVVLVAHIGMAPAIAAVVAGIIIKLFFRNAYAAMCEVWKKKLP